MAKRKPDPVRRIKAVESANERARAIEEAIRLAWSSLDSHLPWCHSESEEGEAFHRQCVKEYAHLIGLLSSMY